MSHRNKMKTKFLDFWLKSFETKIDDLENFSESKFFHSKLIFRTKS